MLAAAVDSTTLATVTYDSPGQRLWIEFRSGDLYCYFAVPPLVHQALMAAPSKGAYFNRNIRGRFSYQRVDPIKRPQPTLVDLPNSLL